MIQRCSWVTSDPLYIQYHDEEWGNPHHLDDDRYLFEMLILEGAQAGLSWITVLKKRENYKKIFDNFDVEVIAKYSDEKLENILKNDRIIRNKLKVFSVRKNALVFLQIQKEFGNFKTYLESFTKRKIEIHRFENLKDYPTHTEVSDVLSKDLKKREMSFVGSTIIYAYMQAIGLVDDHQPQCFCTKK